VPDSFCRRVMNPTATVCGLWSFAGPFRADLAGQPNGRDTARKEVSTLRPTQHARGRRTLPRGSRRKFYTLRRCSPFFSVIGTGLQETPFETAFRAKGTRIVPAELPNRSVSVDYPKTAPDMRFRWETFTALTRSQAGLVDVRLIVHGTPPLQVLECHHFANRRQRPRRRSAAQITGEPIFW